MAVGRFGEVAVGRREAGGCQTSRSAFVHQRFRRYSSDKPLEPDCRLPGRYGVTPISRAAQTVPNMARLVYHLMRQRICSISGDVTLYWTDRDVLSADDQQRS